MVPLANQASTPAPQTVSSATQQSRAEMIWHLHREIDQTEKQIENDTLPQIAAENAAARIYEITKEERMRVQGRHSLAGRVKELQENLNILKAQFLSQHEAGDPKTVETSTGDKVQLRSRKTVQILDGKRLAEILIEKDLWEAAQAQISASDTLLVPLIKNGTLAEVAEIEEKLSIALIGQRE